MVKAFWTAAMSPPFLNRFPFADEFTIGQTPVCTHTLGKPITEVLAVANVKPATVLLRMNSRLLIFFLIQSSKSQTKERSDVINVVSRVTLIPGEQPKNRPMLA